ncbi:hypothetical protein BJ508DRAFT_131265 [Ascobolus immersus RN42]|uniref:Uncharacterized protein n=1 Tax=Ascobolus immersus RN42 TaxID=1160509 RepID=A0A3N4I2E9_ASCIM|nr:hypothetical protein BJ508DRAFT_131265 [Ascobolus immersus RN42]
MRLWLRNLLARFNTRVLRNYSGYGFPRTTLQRTREPMLTCYLPRDEKLRFSTGRHERSWICCQYMDLLVLDHSILTGTSLHMCIVPFS